MACGGVVVGISPKIMVRAMKKGVIWYGICIGMDTYYVLSESSNVGVESTSLLPLGYSDDVICGLRDSDAFTLLSKRRL